MEFNELIKKAENGDTVAMFKIGDYYSRQGNDAEAFKWHLKAAKLGANFSMSELGTMYLKGAGVEKNEKEGFKWILKAAESGHVASMAMVARMYEIGYIVEPDINEALKWYTEAANAGEPHAQQRLKTLFDEGR